MERIPLLEAPVPAYPVALMDRPIYEGHAVVGCLVAADGAVLETWAMRASHRAFADSAERAIREWRYAPAPTGADQMGALPVRVDLVRINYSLTGSIISQTQMQAQLSAFPDSENRLPPLFDKPVGKNAVPVRLKGNVPKPIAGGSGGSVVVEFFIDAGGSVRLPVALNAPNHVYAESALAAVRAWQFAAPQVDGKPASVRVRWNFTFNSA